MNIQISVIIPVYNVEKYLRKCIESVLNQSFRNYEIILVDDGSTDSSGLICDEYSSKYDFITVIHKANGGLSQARNRGIDTSVGDYIIFIDSDDYVHPEMFKTLFDLNKKCGSEISACDKAFVFENNGLIEYGTENEKEWIFTPEEAFVKITDFYGKLGMEMWNKLYKRELFNQIRFPEGKIFEDQATQYKLIFNAKKISYIEKSLYFYLRRENSITTQIYSEKEKQRLEMVNQMVSFIRNEHCNILPDVVLYKLLSCNLTIINKMIKAGIYDYDFLGRVKQDTEKELNIINYEKISMVRKIQFLLILKVWPLYKLIYKICFGWRKY